MAGDDDIDWSGFDYKPPPAPVIPAAQQLAEVINDDAITSAARSVDYDVTRFAVLSPFECKDALKHLGCKWNSAKKIWVAKDAAMHKAASDAVALHFKRQGKANAWANKQRRCATFGPARPLPAGTVVSVGDNGVATVAMGVPGVAPDPEPQPDPGGASDEVLIDALTRRGYTVAKLGVHQTLAELLCDDVDPFAGLEDL